MTQYARPDSFTDDNATYPGEYWTGDHTNIDNTDDPTGTGADSDYLEGQDYEVSFKVGLSNVTDPETGADHKLYFRFKSGTDENVTLTVQLKEGDNVRAERVITDTTTPALGSSFTYNSATSGATGFNLTTSEANSISNYNNLDVFVDYENGETQSDYPFISQIVFECPDAGGGSTAVPVALNTYRQMREN